MAELEIPVLRIEKLGFQHGDSGASIDPAFIKEMRKALETVGFFYLEGFDVAKEQGGLDLDLEKVLKIGHEFFEQKGENSSQHLDLTMETVFEKLVEDKNINNADDETTAGSTTNSDKNSTSNKSNYLPIKHWWAGRGYLPAERHTFALNKETKEIESVSSEVLTRQAFDFVREVPEGFYGDGFFAQMKLNSNNADGGTTTTAKVEVPLQVEQARRDFLEKYVYAKNKSTDDTVSVESTVSLTEYLNTEYSEAMKRVGRKLMTAMALALDEALCEDTGAEGSTHFVKLLHKLTTTNHGGRGLAKEDEVDVPAGQDQTDGATASSAVLPQLTSDDQKSTTDVDNFHNSNSLTTLSTAASTSVPTSPAVGVRMNHHAGTASNTKNGKTDLNDLLYENHDQAHSYSVPATWMTEASDASWWYLRVLHYKGIIQDDPNNFKVSMAPHTDFGWLTLLNQDSTETPALQIQDIHNNWHGVAPRKNAIIVNIGDMMSAWSNGRYLARLHRVIHSGKEHRVSVPFFYNPSLDAKVPLKLKKDLKEQAFGVGGSNTVKVLQNQDLEYVYYGEHLARSLGYAL
ncbi:unnamed protein product [Amoebophrya sp. A120]|nr:unnamed protein product [Amoebophrya sp. A120]|eukprot:GSA120T00013706001.1